MRCPYCNGPAIRRSHRRGLAESVLAWCGKWPYRCRLCRGRFFLPYRYVDAPSAGEFLGELMALSAAVGERTISPARQPQLRPEA